MPRWLCRTSSPKCSSRCLPWALARSKRAAVEALDPRRPPARVRGAGLDRAHRPGRLRSAAPPAGSCRPRPPAQARAVQSRCSASATRLSGGVDLAPEARLGVVALAGGVEGAGQLGPARRRLGGQRRLGAAGLLEEARVHEAEGAAAGAAALDHLVAEAGAPLPVLGDLGPAARLLGEALDRAEAGELAELGARPSPAAARSIAAGIAARSCSCVTPPEAVNMWPASG